MDSKRLRGGRDGHRPSPERDTVFEEREHARMHDRFEHRHDAIRRRAMRRTKKSITKRDRAVVDASEHHIVNASARERDRIPATTRRDVAVANDRNSGQIFTKLRDERRRRHTGSILGFENHGSNRRQFVLEQGAAVFKRTNSLKSRIGTQRPSQSGLIYPTSNQADDDETFLNARLPVP